jgi:hypothetical protein
MRFKQYIQNEGMLGSAFNFIKDKLSGFFNYIKSFVLRSKKVSKDGVTFSFPKFNEYFENTVVDNSEDTLQSQTATRKRPSRLPQNSLRGRGNQVNYILELLRAINNEDLFKHYNVDYLNSLPYYKIKEITFQLEKAKDSVPLDAIPIKSLSPPDQQSLGLLFEMECYFMILNKGFQECDKLNLPPWYINKKNKYINFYQQMLKHVDELTNLIIGEAKKTMPCVNCVIFSGGADGVKKTGRQDPADIKFACKEESDSSQFGYSVKYKMRDNNLIGLGSYKEARYDFDNIKNINDFVNFLNKMLSEYKKTYLIIGGESPYYVYNYIKEYLSVNPENPSQFLPADEGDKIQRRGNVLSFKGIKLYMPPKSSTVLLALDNLQKDMMSKKHNNNVDGETKEETPF